MQTIRTRATEPRAMPAGSLIRTWPNISSTRLAGLLASGSSAPSQLEMRRSCRAPRHDDADAPLDHQERAVLHLGHGADVARGSEPDIGRDISLAAGGRQVELGVEWPGVRVREDVDGLDVALRRHR